MREHRAQLGDLRVRQLFLALVKNPVGFTEVLRTILGRDGRRTLLIAINDLFADGTDVSWLWDVEFERVRGRRVIAAGERAADLAVRLRYADVDCDVWDGSILDAVARLGAAEVDVVANYTVFADLVRAVGSRT